MRWIVKGVAALATLSLAAPALAGAVADCFQGVLPPARVTDTEIGRASWSTACGDGRCADACEPSCGVDSCGDAGCCEGIGCGCASGCGVASGCGTGCGCGVGCGAFSGGRCCPPNCGPLGGGLLTYDACAEGSAIPELLLGCLSCPTEGCFDDFISPMTNPVHFEDPRNVTEVRFIYWQHRVPATALGGNVNLYALQIRARLTDRLSLIATKD
ncbi:MAG: hypothetical protein AAF805_12855, partial [Planctomycetota bacterium]